jgi:hypothetical protein
LAALVVLLAGAAVYECSTQVIGDGGFSALVRVDAPGRPPVRGVRYERCSDLEQAERLRQAVQEYGDRGVEVWQDARPTPTPQGPSFECYVWVATHESPLRLARNSYFQQRCLLLRIEFEGGETVYQVLEVPDGRTVPKPIALTVAITAR